jgi:hypothetical protein
MRTRNIYVLCKDLLDGNLLRGGGADKHHCGSLTFDIKRPFAKDATNMHWISPSDDVTQQDLLAICDSPALGMSYNNLESTSHILESSHVTNSAL